MPESLWWGSQGRGDFSQEPKEAWNWKLMVRIPDGVGVADLDAARATLEARGKGDGVDLVKLETIEEGRCVQALHLGPYDTEGTTVDGMLTMAGAEGLHPAGRYHEIYLSDPRRTAPEKLRTILRMPVAKT
jgi:hypothetical protein